MKTKLHLLFIAILFSLGLQAQNTITVNNQPDDVEAGSVFDFSITYTKDPAVTEAIIQVKFIAPDWSSTVTYGNKTVTADSDTTTLSVTVPSTVDDDYILEVQLMVSPTWANLKQVYYYGTDVVAATTLSTADVNTIDGLTVSPNPFTDSFTYSADSSEPISIELYTIDGSKVLTTTSRTVNTESLSSGVYFARFTSGDVQEVKKLIKN